MAVEDQTSRAPNSPTTAAQFPVFVPLLLIVLALTVMRGFQSIQLNQERELLNERLTLQSEPLTESGNIRQQLHSMIADTAELAKNGNPNAQRIIDQLKKAGITLNSDHHSD